MDSNQTVLKHYLREDVQREVTEFSRNRWVALEARPINRKRLFYRYIDEKPLTITEPADIKKLINRFSNKNIRTIYGSINIYRNITSKHDLENIQNILRTTPSIDIDGNLEEIDLTIEAAKTILEELYHHDIGRSVYLVWSGRGIHIHLNEKALAEDYWKPDPVKTAHTIVEYLLKRTREKLSEIISKSKSAEKRLKIENIIDIQRVFTSPLSIHRELDIVAVTINPEEIENFTLEWTRLGKFRYWREWSQYVEGELDKLVEEALKEIRSESITKTVIGEEPEKTRRELSPIKSATTHAFSIGRFQVMALLQAARHYILYGDLDRAKSFGLNRAIFYAWAKKRGITHKKTLAKPAHIVGEKISEIEEVVGDELVYKTSRGWYTIGGQEQTPKDFDKQIMERFGSRESFQRYWMSAIRYLQRFPLETIKSQREFYEKIYLPVRDNIDKILKES